MKDSPREHFRWAPHTGGLAIVKPKDYEPGGEGEAPSPYALWKQLAAEGQGRDALVQALAPGDVLEEVTGDAPGPLYILKYIGFEPAQWFQAAVKGEEEISAFAGAPADAHQNATEL